MFSTRPMLCWSLTRDPMAGPRVDTGMPTPSASRSSAHGRAWLTDPGTCSYPKEKPDRDRFRGTGAHNTLEVDELSQADPVHSFAWDRLPKTTVHRWHEGREFTLFHGSHDGYQRLTNPVTHSRWIIAWSDGVWLVRDLASGEGAHKLAKSGGFCRRAVHSCRVRNGSSPMVQTLWRFVLHRRPAGPPLAANAHGHTPDGAAVLAPALQLSYEGPLPAECVTLGGWNQRVCAPVHLNSGKGVSVWVARREDRYRIAMFAIGAGMWNFEGIESDMRITRVRLCRRYLNPLFLCWWQKALPERRASSAAVITELYSRMVRRRSSRVVSARTNASLAFASDSSHFMSKDRVIAR